MLRIKINGLDRECAEGQTILQAAKSFGIEVPTLCYDERLKPYGGCRLCIVQLQGISQPVTSCNTVIRDGMEIETHSDEVERQRRTLLKLLIQKYPYDAVLEYPDKPFHRYIMDYGLHHEAAQDVSVSDATDEVFLDASHPYIQIDMSRCIYCYRCVRICSELQGQFVWQVWNRGDQTRILPDSRTTLLESSCVSCGACVDSCPTGALEDQSTLNFPAPETWTKTTCPYCGTGCEMNVGTSSGRIVSIKPVLDAPVNKGHLCVKGRYAFEFVYAKERITEPMIKRDGVWETVTWDEAITFTASKLKAIKEETGPDSIAVLGSSRATNEENYVTQKFARLVVGTNNVDCCARVCHTPSAKALKTMLGTGAATNSYDDIEKTSAIMVVGANPTENHPIIGARIKQAAIAGTPLIVIDPRKIELAKYATLHLPLKAGTNILVLNSMAHVIIQEKLYDYKFIQERVSGWDEFCEFIKDYAPEAICEKCGLDAELLRNAARLYATSKPAMCFHGLGMTEHTQGTEGVMCLVNLALLTGNLGKEGAGVNPLRGQNNVQGSAHMGCDPATLPGGISIKDGKAHTEKVWNANIPETRGLNQLEMIDGALSGNVKALWAVGYDVLLSNANLSQTRESMKRLELVIIQDLFLNVTAKEFGSVFFPVASSFEKEGTFMNAERRIQKIRKVIEPIGQSKTDWEIFKLVEEAMGNSRHLNFSSEKDIWNECRKVWKGGYGISYDRIEKHGLQWPCSTTDHPGTQTLHVGTFTIGKQAALKSIPFRPTHEKINEEFPFMLVTGRTLYQFNAGTMTGHTNNNILRPTDYLDMCFEDIQRLNLCSDDLVRIQSRHGSAILPVKINDAVKSGELFATFHTPEILLNLVTSPERDNLTKTPEYKVTAVRIEKIL